MSDSNFTPQEVWKAIPDWSGYEVSDRGRVRSYWYKGHRGQGNGQGTIAKLANEPQKILKPSLYANGYYGISFCYNYRRNTFYIHRLVLLSFVGGCPPGMEACHNDGGKTNNNLSNLRWDTSKNNNHDKINHGTKLMGVSNPQCKLTPSQVIEIRKLYSKGKYSQYDIANLFDVSRGQVGSIVTRKQWKHI